MLYLALAVGFVAGVIATGALAHNYPLMFIDPEKYFSKLAKKLERKADKVEEGAKSEIKSLLRDLISVVNRINLVR